MLANSEYRHELETDIEPFKGLLLGLFFIAVGASIDFALVAEQPRSDRRHRGWPRRVKFAVLFVLGARLPAWGWIRTCLFAFALAQGGEFAFVLFSFACSTACSGGATGPLVAVVALSMALTPLLMLLNERMVQPRFGTRRPSAAPDEITARAR